MHAEKLQGLGDTESKLKVCGASVFMSTPFPSAPDKCVYARISESDGGGVGLGF